MQVRHILAKYETRKETSNMQLKGDDQIHSPYEGNQLNYVLHYLLFGPLQECKEEAYQIFHLTDPLQHPLCSIADIRKSPA
jgi:hypothetical protein